MWVRDIFSEPCDAPHITDFRLVDMFSSCIHEATKIKILELFTTNSKGCIWNGIDCPDIEETGRAGRNRKRQGELVEIGVQLLLC